MRDAAGAWISPEEDMERARSERRARRREAVEKELAAAIVAAQKHARGVQKDSTNAFHKYNYASAEDVIREARGALASAGLALYASGYVCNGAPESGGAVLACSYVVAHESGATIAIESATPIVPEKGRPADKAVATAKTYDLSYTLRALLLLPRGVDDDDPDARDDRPEPDSLEQVKERVRALFRAMGTEVATRTAGLPDASWTIETWREAEKRLAAEQERRVAAAKEIK